MVEAPFITPTKIAACGTGRPSSRMEARVSRSIVVEWTTSLALSSRSSQCLRPQSWFDQSTNKTSTPDSLSQMTCCRKTSAFQD